MLRIGGFPWGELAFGARFLAALPSFLRYRVNPDEAKAVLRVRLSRRSEDFLDLVRRAIYVDPENPYRRLLDHAGCHFEDVARLVAREGLEGCLIALLDSGVYLSVDELKGRVPVVRGSLTFLVDPVRLQNPWTRLHLPIGSSGSRGAPLRVLLNLPNLRELALDYRLALDARGGSAWVKGLWTVPGSSGLSTVLLTLVSYGQPPERWFSHLDPSTPDLPARYQLTRTIIELTCRALGAPLPSPEYAPSETALPVLRWVDSVRASRRTPFLATYPSSAVELCRAASDEGISLEGVQLSLRGEPVTQACIDVLARAGVHGVPLYGATETGTIAQGCLRPAAADEVHLLSDLHVLSRTDRPTSRMPAGALFLTSLRSTARLILLNVSPGDAAKVATRSCGCPLEELGWTTHLSNVRSFQKLTAGGMTFFDSDVIRVLEEDLPSRFGGGPRDYQVVESSDAEGRSLLHLVVSPQVGAIDEALVRSAFLEGLSRASDAYRMMVFALVDKSIVRIVRQPPHSTVSGKIQHFHVEPS